MLYDPKSHEVLDEHNRDRPFIPASTAKVPSILSSLEILGEDFRYPTILARTGVIQDGVLKGDLYLKGSGDPLLRVRDLESMIDRLVDEGLRKVEGRFYFDDTLLPRLSMLDETMEIDGAYNAGLSALSLEYNATMAYWPKKNRTDREAFLVPDLPIHSLRLSEKEAKDGILFDFAMKDGVESWTLHPDESTYDFTSAYTRLPVRDAGLYTAYFFRLLLSQRGIDLPVPVRKRLPDGAAILALHRGLTALELARIAIEYSNNLMTELLYLTAQRKSAGRFIDYPEASERIREYYRSRIPDLPWKDFYMANGSGLSSRTGITPEQMVAIQLYSRTVHFQEGSFRDLPPLSGWDWSLQRRMNEKPYTFRLRAKTGAINYAIALTGWLVAASGRELVFAFFVNDRDLRARHEATPDNQSRDNQRAAAIWSARAKNVMDQRIQDWITGF